MQSVKKVGGEGKGGGKGGGGGGGGREGGGGVQLSIHSVRSHCQCWPLEIVQGRDGEPQLYQSRLDTLVLDNF